MWDNVKTMIGSEEKLLARLLAGEKAAFEQFYKQTSKQLLGYAVKKTASMKDAEEIVHDTYLSLLDSLPIFEGKSSLKTFLISILRHELSDYWRKRYAKKAIRTVPFMDQVYTEKLYSAKQTALAIKRAYEQLKPWEKKVLKFKYEEGMSVRRIAKHMGWSIKAAESRLFRARRSFKMVFEKVEAS